jgi:hypothetical protein
MDRETQIADELGTLRRLCDEAATREVREQLMRSLNGHLFLEPEHQVAFESIRILLSRGPISAALLRVHLNNRGFPDTDVEKYFQSAPSERTKQPATNKVAT